MTIVFHAAALAFYLAATALQSASLLRGQRLVPRTSLVLIALAVLLHASGLAAFVATYRELPLVGLAPSLSTLALLIGAFLLVLAAFREGRPVELVLLPIVMALLGGALVLHIRPAGHVMAFRGWWLAFHVVLGFIGYVGLAISFAAGLLYLVQFRELKGKRFGRMYRFFPSLASSCSRMRR